MEKGYFYKWSESHFKNLENDSVRWASVFACLAQGFSHFLGGVFYIISLQYAMYA